MIRHNGQRRRLIAHSGRRLFWAWIRSALYYTLRAMAYCIKARWHRAPIPLSSQLTQLLIGQPQQVNTKEAKHTGAEDENVPFLVLKYGANFAEIQRNTALVLSQIQQNSSYIF